MVDNWVKKGLTIAVIILFMGVSFQPTNVVGFNIVQSSKCVFRITIDIITYKQRFPRLYSDGSYFNATIIVTNKGLNTFAEFDLIVLLSQSFPYPRVPNEYEKREFNLSLEPSESLKINFSCKPIIMARYFALFPLDITIIHNNEYVKLKKKIFIVYDPIIEYYFERKVNYEKKDRNIFNMYNVGDFIYFSCFTN